MVFEHAKRNRTCADPRILNVRLRDLSGVGQTEHLKGCRRTSFCNVDTNHSENGHLDRIVSSAGEIARIADSNSRLGCGWRRDDKSDSTNHPGARPYRSISGKPLRRVESLPDYARYVD